MENIARVVEMRITITKYGISYYGMRWLVDLLCIVEASINKIAL